MKQSAWSDPAMAFSFDLSVSKGFTPAAPVQGGGEDNSAAARAFNAFLDFAAQGDGAAAADLLALGQGMAGAPSQGAQVGGLAALGLNLSGEVALEQPGNIAEEAEDMVQDLLDALVDLETELKDTGALDPAIGNMLIGLIADLRATLAALSGGTSPLQDPNAAAGGALSALLAQNGGAELLPAAAGMNGGEALENFTKLLDQLGEGASAVSADLKAKLKELSGALKDLTHGLKGELGANLVGQINGSAAAGLQFQEERSGVGAARKGGEMLQAAGVTMLRATAFNERPLDGAAQALSGDGTGETGSTLTLSGAVGAASGAGGADLDFAFGGQQLGFEGATGLNAKQGLVPENIPGVPFADAVAASLAADGTSEVQALPLAATGTTSPGEIAQARNLQAAYGALPPPPVAPQVALAIARQAEAGNSRFEIRLDPPELGRIDVQLDIDAAGSIAAKLTVERIDTLDLLQRDQRALERALQQAGFDGTRTNLEFSLKQGGSGGGERGQYSPGHGGHGASTGAADAPTNEPGSAPPLAYRANRGASGLNIFV